MSEHHQHDTGYKYLFSHAELVQELIEGFLPAELTALLPVCLQWKTPQTIIKHVLFLTT